jgi:hypothetical protein
VWPSTPTLGVAPLNVKVRAEREARVGSSGSGLRRADRALRGRSGVLQLLPDDLEISSPELSIRLEMIGKVPPIVDGSSDSRGHPKPEEP